MRGHDLLKRAFDVVVALVGLVLMLPLFIALGLLIKLGTKGPIFYRGVRMGRFGIPFRIFKFRTMVSNAEQLGGGSTAKDDPRVTRIGRFLRKYKIDELPQVLNVLRGDMSIVGPRPELVEYTRLYVGEEELILTVRPGITDYASLEFIRLGELLGNEEPDRIYEEKIRPVKNALRVKYVKEQNFGTDLKIIGRTIVKIVAGS
jgi:lipopolysaccharide/colanic/teichoic acid biosynthesis glycosyltransferase